MTREHRAELRANGMAPKRRRKAPRAWLIPLGEPVFSSDEIARTERDLAAAAAARRADALASEHARQEKAYAKAPRLLSERPARARR